MADEKTVTQALADDPAVRAIVLLLGRWATTPVHIANDAAVIRSQYDPILDAIRSEIRGLRNRNAAMFSALKDARDACRGCSCVGIEYICPLHCVLAAIIEEEDAIAAEEASRR